MHFRDFRRVMNQKAHYAGNFQTQFKFHAMLTKLKNNGLCECYVCPSVPL
jgi:hypothetical protein